MLFGMSTKGQSLIPLLIAGALLPRSQAQLQQPTCATVKQAYKDAECCGASDKETRTVDVGVHRPGCKSVVASSATSGPIVGGTLYVYDPSSNSKDWKMINGKNYVDLAEISIAAGCVPKHKPHMVLPSPDGKHTAITYTGDQDFVILKNDEYKAMFCPTVDFLKPSVFGGATHTGAWYGTDSFLLLDMTGCVNGVCGGGVYRFDFDFDNQGVMTGYAFKSALGVDGVKTARGTTATKPIALGNNPLGDYKDHFFVSDAKGAGSIMNAKDMTWVKHFAKSEFGDCPSGGLWIAPHPSDPAIVLAQYGTQGVDDKTGKNCLFKVNMADLTLTLFAPLSDNTDAHGLQFCKTTGGDLTVLNTNRQTSTLDVIKYETGEFLLQGYDLNEKAFDSIQAKLLRDPSVPNVEGKPAPLELGQKKKLQPDVVYMHNGNLYMAARGPRPVSAVRPQNAYENAHPGVMVLTLDPATCLPTTEQTEAFALTTLERSPEITSDVHGAWGVMNGNNMEIWAVDQAGTGSVQTYQVYSACPAMGTSSVHADPDAVYSP